jgi:hypothetical protein
MKTLLLLFLLPLQIFSQDLTGVWTGYLQVGDTRLPYELAISGKGNDLKGYSQLIFTFNGVENVGIKTMELKMKRGSITVEDGELIYDNYTTPGRRVKLYASLAWVGKDLNMTLAGTFATRSMDMRALNENSFKGTVFLQRKNPLTQTRLISTLNDMGLSDKLSFVKADSKKEEKIGIKTGKKIDPSKEIKTPAKQPEIVQRKTEIIRRISLGSDSIVISLYDNGEVDGDTVSVILNGKVILSKQGLTAKAITKTIYLNEIGDSSVLIMYAENLGRIPPNTGLLVIQSGYERYQVRFSGDLQNSSAVILRRRH